MADDSLFQINLVTPERILLERDGIRGDPAYR